MKIEYTLRTLGEPALLDPTGRTLLLTPGELLTLALVRLDSGKLASLGRKKKRASRHPSNLIHADLSRVRKKLPAGTVRDREMLIWVRGLRCDATELQEEEKRLTPAARSILLKYQPFLKTPALNEFPDLRPWREEKAKRLASAFQNVCKAVVFEAQSERDWQTVMELSEHALEIDPGCEVAYEWLVNAAGRIGDSKPAIKRGNALVQSHLKRFGRVQPAMVPLLHAFEPGGLYYSAQIPTWLNDRGEIAAKLDRSSGTFVPASPLGRSFHQHDVFFAAPMAALTDEEYPQHRNDARAVVEVIRGLNTCAGVFYAGEMRARKEQFAQPAAALRGNLDLLRESRIFVMVHPRDVASSTILEAGFALLLAKPTLILVKEGVALPFLLREVHQVFDAEVCTYTSMNELLAIILDRVPVMLKRVSGA